MHIPVFGRSPTVNLAPKDGPEDIILRLGPSDQTRGGLTRQVSDVCRYLGVLPKKIRQLSLTPKAMPNCLANCSVINFCRRFSSPIVCMVSAESQEFVLPGDFRSSMISYVVVALAAGCVMSRQQKNPVGHSHSARASRMTISTTRPVHFLYTFRLMKSVRVRDRSPD